MWVSLAIDIITMNLLTLISHMLDVSSKGICEKKFLDSQSETE